MRRSFVVVVLVPGLLMGCRRLEDCELYNTCRGDLIDVAKEMASLAGEAAVAECRECAARECKTEARDCSVDVECNYTARCQLKRTADDYQQCLTLLRERGYTDGTEARKPWEGSIHEDPERMPLLFGDCVHRRCEPSCSAGRFLCENTSTQYKDLRLTLAVRTFTETDFKIAPGVSVRACFEDKICTGWATTDEDGLRTFLSPKDKPDSGDTSAVEDTSRTYDLPDKNIISPESLYFELRPDLEKRTADFPVTFYYPGRLGSGGPQLVPIYLVLADRIARGNSTLGRGLQVLTDAAQSLILPDSCIWEENSAPNMRIGVENVSQCAKQERCGGENCEPCIWYAWQRLPSTTTTQTDGTGAGIVGLSSGPHTIRVYDKDGEVISSRTVLMRKGAMTIVRTWPLPKEMRDELTMQLPWKDLGI